MTALSALSGAANYLVNCAGKLCWRSSAGPLASCQRQRKRAWSLEGERVSRKRRRGMRWAGSQLRGRVAIEGGRSGWPGTGGEGSGPGWFIRLVHSFAPCAFSSKIIAESPLPMAVFRAVLLRTMLAFTSDPLSIRSSAISRWPAVTALIRRVI